MNEFATLLSLIALQPPFALAMLTVSPPPPPPTGWKPQPNPFQSHWSEEAIYALTVDARFAPEPALSQWTGE